jgi:chemotaxis protein methyltransferase CheR
LNQAFANENKRPQTVRKGRLGTDMDGTATMDRKTFDALRDLVYQHCGIALSDQKESLVSARIAKRLRALGLSDYKEYLHLVENDSSGEETVQMLDAISTNVTSFFREPDHFTFLTEVMTRWQNEGQTRFRVWCAASSTGEEPYTLSMTLQETPKANACDMKILATDISTRVLAHAQAGIYGERQIQGVSASLRDKYFQKQSSASGTTFAAKESIKSRLTFRRLNLATPPFPMKGPLDVIFCRNVMIYFDNTVRARLLEEMYRLLKPGGYLVVGHAESLTGLMSRFKSVRPSAYIK